MTNDKPILISVTSDHHTNSTIGLCKPTRQLDDGGTYKLSDGQRWLWRCWKDYIEQVQHAQEFLQPAKTIAVFNGDVFDGDHHGTAQIITRNPATMQRIGFDTLEPLINLADDLYVVRGTEAHNGKSDAAEEELAADVGAIGPGKDIYSWWHLPLQVYKTRIDFAHHATMGRLPWTRRAGAVKTAAVAMFNAAERKVIPPDLVIRSHRHQWSDSGDNYPTRAIHMGAWQLATAYVQRIDAGAVAEVGGLIIVVWPDGSYEVRKVRYNEKPRAWVKA